MGGTRSFGTQQGPGARSRRAAARCEWPSNRGSRSPAAKTVVRRCPRSSSGCGRAMTSPRRNQTRRKKRSYWIRGVRSGDGETTGGLKVKPGEAPADTAAFSELEGGSAARSLEQNGVEGNAAKRVGGAVLFKGGGCGPTENLQGDSTAVS